MVDNGTLAQGNVSVPLFLCWCLCTELQRNSMFSVNNCGPGKLGGFNFPGTYVGLSVYSDEKCMSGENGKKPLLYLTCFGLSL